MVPHNQLDIGRRASSEIIRDMMITRFHGETRYLSNFAPAEVVLDGEVYLSTEHAFQAAKTLDKETREKIRNGTPGQAKRLGRKIKIRDDWDEMRLSTMETLLRQKFLTDNEYGKKLMATGTQEIVEGNRWHDQFWGSCDCPKCGGGGQNNLGKLLMKIRAELLEEKG